MYNTKTRNYITDGFFRNRASNEKMLFFLCDLFFARGITIWPLLAVGEVTLHLAYVFLISFKNTNISLVLKRSDIHEFTNIFEIFVTIFSI